LWFIFRDTIEGSSGNFTIIALIVPFSIIYFVVCTVIIIKSCRKTALQQPAKGEVETFSFKTTKCPYCNSSATESGVIYQAKLRKKTANLIWYQTTTAVY
jgi:hypothetical protein